MIGGPPNQPRRGAPAKHDPRLLSPRSGGATVLAGGGQSGRRSVRNVSARRFFCDREVARTSAIGSTRRDVYPGVCG